MKSAGEAIIELTIGEPDDQCEREADAVADHVMRMADEAVTHVAPTACSLQRKCGACDIGHEETLVQKPAEPSSASAQGISTTAPAGVHQVLNAPGRPLPMETRAFFEPRFDHDFSRVRVHADGAAQQSARDVYAHAYTVGHHIVFGTGKFSPSTAEGARLLAHELTHVVQQSRTNKPHDGTASPRLLQRAGLGDVAASEQERAEREANAVRVDPNHFALWFRFDSTALRSDEWIDSEQAVFLLAELVAFHELEVGEEQTITLQGYASEEGDAGHNLELSRQRAEVVRDLLVAAGTPAGRITIEAYGADQSFDELELNRRVEVELQPTVTRIEGELAPVVGSRCHCNTGSRVVFRAEAFEYIQAIAPAILQISQQRNVPPVAVAIAIAEEFDSRTFPHSVVDWYQDNILPIAPEWVIGVHRVIDIEAKFFNIVEHDLGNANIHLRTAIELVESGRVTVPGSPPTDVQVNLIVDHLLEERGMVDTAAAVIEQAQQLFAPHVVDYDAGYQDAILVDFFNIGYEKYYEQNFLGKLSQNPNHKPCPDPDGDGCQGLHNRDRIQAILDGS